MAKTDGGIPDFCDKNYHSIRSELINAWGYISLKSKEAKTMKLELSENTIKELRAALAKAENDRSRKVLRLEVCNSGSSYSAYHKTHSVKQIFHKIDTNTLLAIPTERWCGGYYFDSDTLIVGERYMIENILYHCRLKCNFYIELEEV